MKKALVCGAGGFIGTHLVRRLKKEGLFVRGVDRKYPEFSPTAADEFIIGDLRDRLFCGKITGTPFDEVYQLAAEMGGAGYVFTGENDADIMRSSVAINVNMAEACRLSKAGKVFYSSSACVYPAHNQQDPADPKCSEDTAYPACPDSEYGWEKLFSERLYAAYRRNYSLDIRVARLHNIFGPECAWRGGREKAPAAICRKAAQSKDGGEIEIWGDGKQTRSFLYVDECVEAVIKLMRSDFPGPVNIGSAHMVTIDELARMIIKISGKCLTIKHVKGPTGVRGRNSDNRLISEKLGWAPSAELLRGMEATYGWIGEMAELAVLPKKEGCGT